MTYAISDNEEEIHLVDTKQRTQAQITHNVVGLPITQFLER